MPSASVATTSAEIGPSIVLQISTRICSGSPVSFASRLGFVVMPSTTPSVGGLADLLEARGVQKDLHDSILTVVVAGRRSARGHDDIAPGGRGPYGRLASTGSVGSLSLPAWSKAVTV